MADVKQLQVTYELGALSAMYIGDPDKNGTWKIQLDPATGVLKFSQRQASLAVPGTSIWVAAESFTPPGQPTP